MRLVASRSCRIRRKCHAARGFAFTEVPGPRYAKLARCYAFERGEAAALSPVQAARLEANAKAHAWFTAQAPWYQRTAIHWVISAKLEPTRDRRLAELIRDSAAGRRIKQITPATASAKRRAR